MATFEEIIIKVKIDEDGRKAKALEKEIDKLETTLKDTTKSAEQHAEALKKLARAQSVAAQRGGEYNKVANKANKVQNDIATSSKKAIQPMKNLGGSFGSLTGLVRGFIALEAVKYFVQFGTAVSNAGANLETTLVSFSTFLGSTEKATVVVNQLVDASNRTAFTSDQFVTAGKQLLAYGVSAKDLIPTLQRVGAVAAGMGRDAQDASTKFIEITEILGKARVQGRLFNDDLNQFLERGINLVPSLANQLDVADDKIKKMVEQGKVGFPQVEQAFIDMTSAGGQFFGLLEKQSQTQQGLVSTLSGEWQSFLAVLASASGIGTAVKNTLNSMIDTIRDFKKEIAPASQDLTDFNKALGQLDDEQVVLNTERLTNEFKEQKAALRELEVEYKRVRDGASKLEESGRSASGEDKIQANFSASLQKAISEEIFLNIKKQEDVIRFTQERIAIIELEATSRAKAAKVAEAAERTRLRLLEKATLQSNLKIIAIQARTSETIVDNEKAEIADRIEALKTLEAQRIKLANTQRRLAAFDLTSSEVDAIKKRTINFVANAEILKAQENRQKKEKELRAKGFENAAIQTKIAAKEIGDIQLAAFGDEQVGIELDVTPIIKEIDPSKASELVSKYKDFFTAILPDLKDLAFDIADNFFDAQINSLDSAISIQEQRIANARSLAEKGNTSALEQETERFERLQREREQAVNRQLALNRLLTVSEIALAIARTAADTSIASPVTIPIVAAAIGAGLFGISSLLQNIPAFESGGFTDAPKAFAGGDLKGGNLALVNEGGKKEYIAPNWQVTNPQTAPFIDALELNRKGQPFTPPMLTSSLNQSYGVDMAGVEAKLDTLIAVLPSIKSSLSVTDKGIFTSSQKVSVANERANSKR